MQAIIHTEGNQQDTTQARTVEIALKNLAEVWMREYNDARMTYLNTIAKELTASSMLATLDTALTFTMLAQKFIGQTHQQLASSLAQENKFKEVYGA